MPYIFIILTISILLLTDSKCGAQYDNVWTFGKGAGIDFNQNPPVSIKTSIQTNEGCASICDADGRLQFYTDGTDIWNRKHELMPNGRNLPGTTGNITGSTQQGALIVPVPGDAKKYYVFSLGAKEYWKENRSKLYYTIVDMGLDSGLGDVVSGNKGKVLDSNLLEFMTAVTGNNCDFWLLVGSGPMPLKAYNISYNGILPNPVLSPSIAVQKSDSSEFANIDVSPDRGKLIINRSYKASPETILCKFDPGSGRASEPILLSGVEAGGYASCFSPDGSKLYMGVLGSSNGLSVFCQFDVGLYDSVRICSSLTVLERINVYYGAIRRGPDGKLYNAVPRQNRLNVIHYPNRAGTACEFEPLSFTLQPGTASEFGLPNHATIIKSISSSTSTRDTAFCVDQYTLKVKNTTAEEYIWDDGSIGLIRNVTQSGIYWVKYRRTKDGSCIVKEYCDTFHIVFEKSRIISSITSSIARCMADTQLLHPAIPGADNYIWEDGSQHKNRKVCKSGLYIVQYRIDSVCADHIDSFQVTYPTQNPQLSFTADTVVCLGDTLYFENTSDSHFNNFQWSFGDSHSDEYSPRHLYTHPGGYKVMLAGSIDHICPDTVYKTILVDSSIMIGFDIDRDSLCVGESVRIQHTLSAQSIQYLEWIFGDGNALISGQEKPVLIHAYDYAGAMVLTLRSHFRACPDLYYTDTVHIQELPVVSLGEDSVLCWKEQPILLENKASLPSGNYRYQWNTGDTTASIMAVYHGTYSLRVTATPSGCGNSEFLEVVKDCLIDIPNAFTPNEDGINDYFFPRQLFSSSLNYFHMQILNRWGQKIFETTNTDGRGWDGTFNGKDQPQDVYIYLIDVLTSDDRIEKYNGNVTLLR